MQASMYKFTRCGSHALLERNLAQHSAYMAENPPKMEAQEGELFLVFRSCFVLGAKRAQEGAKGPPEISKSEF